MKKEILNLHGYYADDNDGNIYKAKKDGSYKLLSNNLDKQGFKRVNLRVDGKFTTKLVHVLICDTFNVSDGSSFVFLDNDKNNTKLDNLTTVKRLIAFYNKNKGGSSCL